MIAIEIANSSSAAVLTLAAGILIQILIWNYYSRLHRSHVPDQMALLFLIFAGLPFAVFLINGNPDQLVWSLGFGGSYIMTFPAVAAKSPSILIIDYLSRNPNADQGEIFEALVSKADLVGDRVQDLRCDGLSSSKSSEFKPSRAGMMIGYIFLFYRRLLGLPPGEG